MKLLKDILNQCNLTAHSGNRFVPSYLFIKKLLYDPLTSNNHYYPPVDEARKLAKERTIHYHNKNKVCQNVQFPFVKFKTGDDIIHRDIRYPNPHKLSNSYACSHKIINQLS